MKPSRPQSDLTAARQAFRAGDPGTAERLLKRVLAYEPSNVAAHELLGYIAGNRGDRDGAFRHLRKATQSVNASAESWYYLARCFRERGQPQEAVEALGKAMSLKGEFFEALHDLGMALVDLGKPQAALAALDKALAIRADVFQAHFNRGKAQEALGRAEEALASYGESLRLSPRHRESWTNRGALLHDLQRYDEAIAHYDRALALEPADVQTVANRAFTLHVTGQEEEALDAYERALALDPARAENWTFRGAILEELGRHDEAMRHHRKALELDPRLPDARWNVALASLARGDFEAGWQGYEARWEMKGAAPRRHGGIRPWLGGEEVEGKRLLVWAEQGLGDTIQFCRYAPLLARRGAQVLVEAPRALAGLFSTLQECAVVVAGDELPAVDYQIPVLSLPLAFRTTPDSIPGSVPYLSPSPEKVREWAARLSGTGDRRRIGIACSGSLSNRDDRRRSIPLASFGPLQEHADLFLIQKELRDADARYLAESGAGIRYLGKEFGDFSDTAAVVANLDLVISVDTSIAHLAGALGRPVWILLSEYAEWRWPRGREDSPWYPTARLFRQQSRGDWPAVMERVRDALATTGRQRRPA